MKKELAMYDMSLMKFLNLYFGVNPKQGKHITHKDVCQLFSLIPLTDEDIKGYSKEYLMLNYIKVKDENDTIMWYQKLEFDEENVIKECTEEEYNAYTEIEWHFISLANVDISNLSP